jgi:rhodanese-related sulfurtransferase
MIRRPSFWLPAVAVGFVLASCGHEPAPAPVKPKPKPAPTGVTRKGMVTAMDLSTLLQLQQSNRVLLYDARPAVIYTFGHLPGAISLPRQSSTDEITAHEPEIKAALAAGKNVVVYCTDAACPDAGAVADRLAARGYLVSVLEGGFHAWKDAGLPIE